jgi:hypothetical protein
LAEVPIFRQNKQAEISSTNDRKEGRKAANANSECDFMSRPMHILLDFPGTWVAGGLGLGGLGLSVGLGPSPPSVHIALFLLCFLVSFLHVNQHLLFPTHSFAGTPAIRIRDG